MVFSVESFVNVCNNFLFSQDVGNKALNYGYAILTSYIWNALLNAGLEPYCGFFHTTRAEIKQCCALIFNFSLND
jgi:hypothetical protein